MSRRPNRSRKARLAKAAKKLPEYMQDVAFTKWSAKKERRQRNRNMGTFGPASEVRHIRPGEPEDQS